MSCDVLMTSLYGINMLFYVIMSDEICADENKFFCSLDVERKRRKTCFSQIAFLLS